MINQIQQFVKQQHMFEKNDRIVVGVSGGADSMCLLNVLMRIGKEYSLTLFVVHINHQLRGEEADKEEEFVRDFCLRHEISVNCIKVDVKKLAKDKRWSLEEAGRFVRYQAFEEECIQHNCHKIAIAHNMNDNAETILFHLFRGTKIEGMSGIHAVHHRIVRPLLETKREVIEAFMKQENIAYCTDSSNSSLDYTRNKIRNHLLPYAKEQINERSLEHIVSFAKEMERVAKYLRKQTDQAFSRIATIHDSRVELDLKLLQEEDIILQNSIIKMAIEHVSKSKKDIDEKHIQLAQQLMSNQSGKQITLPYHIIVQRGYTTLIVKKQECKSDIERIEYQALIPGTVSVQEMNCEFHFELIDVHGEKTIPKNCYTKWFDYDKIIDAVVIRTRKQGDFLQIHKDGGKKSIKSLLIDAKIPKDDRDTCYLLASGHHVLWIPQVRTSEAFLVDETTTRILSVTLVS